MIVTNITIKADPMHNPTSKLNRATPTVDPESVDSLLAQEFLSLSFQDRNDINEEMHGVACLSPEETPELIKISLAELEREISLIPANDKEKYELSQTKFDRRGSSNSDSNTNSSNLGGTGTYVNDTEFRMRFLRSELFDARKAATKLVDYLDVVCDLFGEYALQRPIQLSDFTEDEMQVFRIGNLQLLPFRDRSGRRIVAGVEGLAMQFDSALRFKILFYLLWAAGDDIETQLKGIVVVIWPVSDVAMKHLQNKERLIKTQKKRLKASPVRVCAFHFCVPDTPFFHILRVVFALTLEGQKRSRLKFHVGQLMELQYLVKGYGLPVDHIPLTETGNVKTQNLRLWLKLRSTLEEGKDLTSSSSFNIIECPGSNDVLFRPSKLIKGHPGNAKFHSLIEYYHENGMGVTAASKEIIAEISKDNGRVLVWDKRGWWTKLANPAQVLFKVSVSYRDYKKKNKAKIQIHNSSTFAFERQDGKKRKRPEEFGPSTSKSACAFLKAVTG